MFLHTAYAIATRVCKVLKEKKLIHRVSSLSLPKNVEGFKVIGLRSETGYGDI